LDRAPRRPALADSQNDCRLATAEWFKVESIIGDLPKHDEPAAPEASVQTENIVSEAPAQEQTSGTGVTA